MRKILSHFFLALTIAIGLTACSKKDSDDIPSSTDDTTVVRFVFTDSTVNEKGGRSKVDLANAAWLKIKYTINDEKSDSKVVKETTLMLHGNSNRISTFDMKVLAFKGGTKLTIYNADLYNGEYKVLGRWSNKNNDVFEVTSPEGELFMDRTYGTIGLEKF